MRHKRRVILAVVSVLLGVIVFFLLYGLETHDCVSSFDDPETQVIDSGASTYLGKAMKQKRRFPKIDKRTRALMLQKMLLALNEKQQKEEKTSVEKPRTRENLPQRYIGQKIVELSPLLKECYVAELEDRGHVSGKVVVEISLIGEEEYGGLVEEVNVLESQLSRERSESFLECLRETLYAIQLDAPEWGGRQTVKYPFYFSAIGF